MKALIAIHLDTRIVDWIGDITNIEEPSVCLFSSSFDTADAIPEDHGLTIIDCIVYRPFINLASIRQSTIL